MKQHRVTLSAVVGLALAAALANTAAALPPRDWPGPVPHCRAGTHWNEDVGRCVPNPPPSINPDVRLDVARQTTSRDGIRVAGWTVDRSQPTTPLSIRVSVDGQAATATVANLSRPDVAAAYPSYGPNHGYDVTVPASSAGHQVCVTATNIGSGSDTTTCTTMDDVIQFDGNPGGIAYDVQHPIRKNSTIESLDHVVHTNGTTVQQSTTISNSKTVTETRGWSSSVGVKVTVSAGVGIPLVADGKITVEGNAQFTWNGSTTSSRIYSWSQPVLVPPKSKVTADILVTKWNVAVPFTLPGTFVYRSGTRAAGSVGGTYNGVNSDQLDVVLTQTDLNGTPAARPVDQAKAKVTIR